MEKNRNKLEIEFKEKLQAKALKKIENYFDLEPSSIRKIDKEVLKHLLSMAKLGMQFEREMNLAKRANEVNYIKVGKLISENKVELRKYLIRTLPSYS